MTPFEFLSEEFENVQNALRETLRHDYGPQSSGDYYHECEGRVAEIGKVIPHLSTADAKTIYAYLSQLSYITDFVSLIERSRLGEFSWPFAEELRRTSKMLLAETALNGATLDPIIHVIAEGQGYRIYFEPQVPVAGGKRRLLVVAFPRSLKHHVLLHALFGHEVGHNAIRSTTSGQVLRGAVLDALSASSPLKSANDMNAWLHSPNAPQDVKDELVAYQSQAMTPFLFTDDHRLYWLEELICDLFGVLLFGPAFVAAHRAYLQALEPYPYSINMAEPTHPSYSIRHKMLVQIMRIVGWDRTVTTAADGHFQAAEAETLNYLLNDPYHPWTKLFDDRDLVQAVTSIRTIFTPHTDLGYTSPSVNDLTALLEKLICGLPPILSNIDEEGRPQLRRIHISQMLYSGWVYWIGRRHLSVSAALDFLTTNRLCDHALLQQRAINYALDAGAV